MDITLIYKTCVKAIKTRNKACGFPEPDKIRKETKKSGTFAARAREILYQVAKLGAFVLETSTAYANFRGLTPGTHQMTDSERDKIDAGVPRIYNEIKNLLVSLEASVVSADLSPQHREHQEGVIRLIREYLRDIYGIHCDLKVQRVARSLEARRFARLDAQRTGADETRAERTIVPWPEENDSAVENLSTEELQVFEEENAALQSELLGLVSELRQVEGKMMEVARLQEQFTEKIVEQDQDIDHVASVVVSTTETLKDANEQLRQAIQRNAGLRVYILFFLLVMSFSLLFLDWYNE